MIRRTSILLGLTLLAAAIVAGGPALAAGAVAESQTSTAHPIATLQTSLDWHHRYTLQVDGPAGATFSLAAVQTYVDARATQQGSADRSSQVQAAAPYTTDLVAPEGNLRYWHYAAVVTPTGGDHVVVRLVAADGS